MKCNRNLQCCSELCVRRKCQISNNCIPDGRRCDEQNQSQKGNTKTPSKKRNTKKPKSQGAFGRNATCCSGSCINKKCQPVNKNCKNATSSNNTCRKRSDCCSRYCYKKNKKAKEGTCRNKEDAICDNKGKCKNDAQCCSKKCLNKKCVPTEKDCSPENAECGRRKNPCCDPLKCERGKCISQKCKIEGQTCKQSGIAEQKCCLDQSLSCNRKVASFKCELSGKCLAKNSRCNPREKKCCKRCTCRKRSGRNRYMEGIIKSEQRKPKKPKPGVSCKKPKKICKGNCRRPTHKDCRSTAQTTLKPSGASKKPQGTGKPTNKPGSGSYFCQGTSNVLCLPKSFNQYY